MDALSSRKARLSPDRATPCTERLVPHLARATRCMGTMALLVAEMGKWDMQLARSAHTTRHLPGIRLRKDTETRLISGIPMQVVTIPRQLDIPHSHMDIRRLQVATARLRLEACMYMTRMDGLVEPQQEMGLSPPALAQRHLDSSPFQLEATPRQAQATRLRLEIAPRQVGLDRSQWAR